MLAGHLGMTVRELLSRIDAGELAEWQALYRIDPWGGARADLGFALVCWMLYQSNRDPKKSPDRKVADFVPDFDREEAAAGRPSSAELKAKLMGATVAAGGRVGGG